MGQLRGRAAELAQLDILVATAAAAGRMRGALIEGEPGIGKTRLWEHAVRAAGEAGLLVRVGHAEELEQDRPFGLLAEVLGLRNQPGASPLAALLLGAPTGEAPRLSAPPPGYRLRALDGIVAAVDNLCAAGPVLLAIEDLHWADDASVLALRHIARRLAWRRLTLLATLRPRPRSLQLKGLVTDLEVGGGRSLVPMPLAMPEVEALATDTLGAPPGPGLRGHLMRTGGSPLYVVELLSALRQEGLITSSAAAAEVVPSPTPQSLRRTILRRLSPLPAPTQTALRMASVLGTAFSLTDLATIMDQTLALAIQDLEPAIEEKLVGDLGGRLVFRHELVREVIYGELTPAARRGLHLHAGRALGVAGAPVTQVAEHLMIGASPGDAMAVGWLRRAASQAASRDPQVAISLVERALQIAPPEDLERDAMLVDLIFWLQWAGRAREATEAAQELLRRPQPPAVQLAVEITLTQALHLGGHVSTGLERIKVLLQREGLPPAVEARMRVEAAFGHLEAGQLAAGLAEATQGYHQAVRVSDRAKPARTDQVKTSH